MSRFAIAIAAAALIPFAVSAQDGAPHSAYIASVATYKPIQGFSHVVGSRHFAGYFVMADDECAVTVINTTAGDDRLIESPRRRKIAIPAGGRTEVQAAAQQPISEPLNRKRFLVLNQSLHGLDSRSPINMFRERSAAKYREAFVTLQATALRNGGLS